ncbi:MAG: hypothetical protein ACI9T7_000179 [Oleiphilaceae bacterium]|jgi:hypothetical protein
MPSEQHEYLSKLAAKWAKKQGFPVVATNLTAAGSREKVDLIAFRSSCSLMIESKISRSDFFADAKKPERVEGGVGTYRFYITPFDMVSSTEIPDGWGLLYVDGKNVIDIIRPKGNLWPSIDCSVENDWRDFMHSADQEAERAMLFSISRRLVSGYPILN